MKAEDVNRLWRTASLEACGVESGYDPPQELLEAFARACEQHGVERAKAAFGRGRSGGVSWLESEIQTENCSDEHR